MKINLQSMRLDWRWIVGLSLAMLVLVGVVIFTRPTPRTCEPRTDDLQGYLLKICVYIQEKQLDVSPADPTNYHIKAIEERQEDNRTVVWVFLNCCYMGDIAVIDKESGEVIDFRLGAK